MTVLAKGRLGSCGHLPRPVSTLAGSRLKVCWVRRSGQGAASEQGLVTVPAQPPRSQRDSLEVGSMLFEA